MFLQEKATVEVLSSLYRCFVSGVQVHLIATGGNQRNIKNFAESLWLKPLHV